MKTMCSIGFKPPAFLLMLLYISVLSVEVLTVQHYCKSQMSWAVVEILLTNGPVPKVEGKHPMTVYGLNSISI